MAWLAGIYSALLSASDAVHSNVCWVWLLNENLQLRPHQNDLLFVGFPASIFEEMKKNILIFFSPPAPVVKFALGRNRPVRKKVITFACNL